MWSSKGKRFSGRHSERAFLETLHSKKDPVSSAGKAPSQCLSHPVHLSLLWPAQTSSRARWFPSARARASTYPQRPATDPATRLQNRPPPSLYGPSQRTDTTSRPFSGRCHPPSPPVRKRPRDSRWGGGGVGVRGPAHGQIGREGPGPPGAETRSPDPGSRHRLGDGAVVRSSAKNLAATTSREAGRGGPYVTPARARAGGGASVVTSARLAGGGPRGS